MSDVAMPSLYGNMIHRSDTVVLTPDNRRLPKKHCTDVRMRKLRWLTRRLYPRRLRNQMIMMAILMVIVPTISIGYIVETEGRSAVLSEKEKNCHRCSLCLTARWAIALATTRIYRVKRAFGR